LTATIAFLVLAPRAVARWFSGSFTAQRFERLPDFRRPVSSSLRVVKIAMIFEKFVEIKAKINLGRLLQSTVNLFGYQSHA
jgi:hypothetical protein